MCEKASVDPLMVEQDRHFPGAPNGTENSSVGTCGGSGGAGVHEQGYNPLRCGDVIDKDLEIKCLNNSCAVMRKRIDDLDKLYSDEHKELCELHDMIYANVRQSITEGVRKLTKRLPTFDVKKIHARISPRMEKILLQHAIRMSGAIPEKCAQNKAIMSTF